MLAFDPMATRLPEQFTYDADGNMTGDGRWFYLWDGENRLERMETKPQTLTNYPNRRLVFTYDYMSRRSVKQVYIKVETTTSTAAASGTMLQDGDSGSLGEQEDVAAPPGTGTASTGSWQLEGTYKFVWDGWNLSVELAGNNDNVRSMAWGLDMSQSEQGAGGVGGLLFVTDGVNGTATANTSYVCYDYNGNVTSLRNNANVFKARYEYGPFGEAVMTCL